MEKMPIGVFTSVGAGLGASIEKVKSLGVPTVQLHSPPAEKLNEDAAKEIKKTFDDAGIKITLVFCGFEGESYESIPIVKETVGLVPSATRAERAAGVKKIADFAKVVDAPGIGIHIGFIPESTEDEDYKALVAVAQELCDYCAGLGLGMHLETGQESANGLLQFIGSVAKPNLAVNFDPANMILYGSGEPVSALKKVGAYVKSCHAKDATWSASPGVEWGVEKPLGKGQVGMEDFIRTLNELGYEGPLTIEREISGDQQLEDIKAAVGLLNEIKQKLQIS